MNCTTRLVKTKLVSISPLNWIHAYNDATKLLSPMQYLYFRSYFFNAIQYSSFASKENRFFSLTEHSRYQLITHSIRKAKQTEQTEVSPLLPHHFVTTKLKTNSMQHARETTLFCLISPLPIRAAAQIAYKWIGRFIPFIQTTEQNSPANRQLNAIRLAFYRMSSPLACLLGYAAQVGVVPMGVARISIKRAPATLRF